MDAAADSDVRPNAPAGARGLRLHRGWRIARNVALALIGLIFAIWLVLFITKGRFLKHPFERTVASLTQRNVSVGGDFQLYFAPLRIKFYAERLAISNPGWASRPDLFTADRIESHIAPLSLLFGKRHIYSLDLTNGAGDLEWDKAHAHNTWSFGDAKGGRKPLELPRIDSATLVGTTVRYVDPHMPLSADLAIGTIQSTDAKIGGAVSVTGRGTVRTTPFRVDAQLHSPNQTIAMGENKLSLRAWAANNVIDVSGTLPSLADVENVPLQTRAHGRDLAELLAIIGVAIPHTRTYDLTAQMVKDDTVYRFTDMRGRFGDSDLAGRLTITNGPRLRLDAALATRQLDIVDAAPFIGYDPDIVASKGAVSAAAATGAGPQRVLPDAKLPIETLQRFDAGLKWKIGVVRSRHVPVSDIGLTLSLDHGRLALEPLTFSMARGDLSADLVFDTRQRPSADSYDIRLAPTPMGRLLAGFGVAEAGTTGTMRARIQLKGRGDSIHDSLAGSSGRIVMIMPQGTLTTEEAQLSELDLGVFAQKMFEGKLKKPVEINCGLIGFTVREGVAAADPILIDTQKNVIAGRGDFSFRDETIDLGIRAHAKKFSLFSGQSPVGLNGTFAKPRINVISPQLLARAGVAVGLGMVATPFAAVLAFVDPGDAKAAACGPVLAGADAAAQRTVKGKPFKYVGTGSPSKK